MPTAYVYEKRGAKIDMGKDAHVRVDQALGKAGNGDSALKKAAKDGGTGGAVGGALGSVVPGIGNVVGGAIGGVVGGIVGLGRSLFGGGPGEGKVRNVLPILLKKVMDQKGAQASHSWGPGVKRGKRGLKIEGKSFKPSTMLQLTKELQQGIASAAGTHSQEDANEYERKYLGVTQSKPEEKRIIASFPVKQTSAQATAQAQNNSPATTNAGSSQIVYAIGAVAAGWYFLN